MATLKAKDIILPLIGGVIAAATPGLARGVSTAAGIAEAMGMRRREKKTQEDFERYRQGREKRMAEAAGDASVHRAMTSALGMQAPEGGMSPEEFSRGREQMASISALMSQDPAVASELWARKSLEAPWHSAGRRVYNAETGDIIEGPPIDQELTARERQAMYEFARSQGWSDEQALDYSETGRLPEGLSPAQQREIEVHQRRIKESEALVNSRNRANQPKQPSDDRDQVDDPIKADAELSKRIGTLENRIASKKKRLAKELEANRIQDKDEFGTVGRARGGRITPAIRKLQESIAHDEQLRDELHRKRRGLRVPDAAGPPTGSVTTSAPSGGGDVLKFDSMGRRVN